MAYDTYLSSLATTFYATNVCYTTKNLYSKQEPSNKEQHHGGAGRRDSGMTVANQPALPPGASSEGVGRGQCVRVLFNSADRPRKN